MMYCVSQKSDGPHYSKQHSIREYAYSGQLISQGNQPYVNVTRAAFT